MKRRTRVALSFLALAALLAPATSRAAQVVTSASLRMDSEQGDYIGGGQKYYYTQVDGTFGGYVTRVNGTSGPINSVHIGFDGTNGTANGHWWYVDFGAPSVPSYQELLPGTYDGIRYPFNDDKYGLSIYGDGRGCNQLSGRFTITRLTIDCEGNLTGLDAQFEQHCEMETPALKGEVHFSANPVSPIYLTLSPYTQALVPGATSTMTASIGTARTSATFVALTSSDPTIVSVPSGVTIPAGEASATFDVTAVAVGGPITVTATLPVEICTTSASAYVTVTENILTLSPPVLDLLAGSSGTLVATMSKVQDSPVVLSLGSTNSSVAAVASEATIPVGSTSTSFQVVAGSPGSATVTAQMPLSLGGATGTTQVNVGSSAFWLSPGIVSLPVGFRSTIQVSLGAARSNTSLVALVSDNPNIASVPSSVTIPAGSTSATFEVTGNAAGGPVLVTATLPDVGTATCQVTVALPRIIIVNTSMLLPVGRTLWFDVYLAYPRPTPTTIYLTSADTSVALPEASIVIPANQNRATVAVTGVAVGGPVSILASSPDLPSGSEDSIDVTVVPAGQTCAASDTTMCLQGGRFTVQVTWQSYADGSSGSASAVPLSDESGYLWFFSAQNVELVVRLVDGRSVNGNYWVFYAALSDLAYQITVTDTYTGKTKTYSNPAHNLASAADVNAFPGGAGASLTARGDEVGILATMRRAPGASGKAPVSKPGVPARLALSACAGGSDSLCLNSGRFDVRVSYRNYNDGSTGSGYAVPLTTDTGYFWFFSSSGVELAVKVLDGTAVNGKFWVIYGSLTDVEFTITVTDTQTGTVKTYYNPPHVFASKADTSAF